MESYKLLIPGYMLFDLLISTLSLGFYLPSWEFQPKLVTHALLGPYSFSSTPSDYVYLTMLRVLLLSITWSLVYLQKPKQVQSLHRYIVVAAFLIYSYSLTKLLVLAETPIVTSYPGLWISVTWTVLSCLIFYISWLVLQSKLKKDYDILDNETDDSSQSESSEESSIKQDEPDLDRRELWMTLLGYCKIEWIWFLGGIGFLTFYGIVRAIIPAATGQVIEDIMEGHTFNQLLWSISFIGILSILSAVFGGVRCACLSYGTAKMSKRIRSELLKSLVHQEIAFYDINKSGEIVSRLTSDCQKISDTISMNLNIFLRNFVMFIGGMVFMCMLSWRLAMINFIVIPPICVLLKIYGDNFEKLAERIQDTVSKANQVAEEIISSMRTVRSFACEMRESGRFDRELDNTLEAYRTRSIGFLFYFCANEMWQNVILVIVLLYGGHLITVGQLKGVQLITFMLYQVQAGMNIDGVYYELTYLMELSGASRKVFQYMHRKPHISLEGEKKPEVHGRVELSNVHFAYPSRPKNQILQGLNLVIPAGQSLALVGPSGGGKSSIVSLIQHFYEPNEGSITLDGVDIGSYSHYYFHERIALVAQEPILYCGSVRYNILYGCDWATEEDMLNAAKMANVHNFVGQLDQGYDTECGEKGIQMSGGQKQRIAIARALVRRPSVLILDEATSALDAESEALVQEALSRCAKERTVLIIAHRLSTIENADRIAFIEKGNVMQLGSHAELMADRNGPYYSLVARQLALQ